MSDDKKPVALDDDRAAELAMLEAEADPSLQNTMIPASPVQEPPQTIPSSELIKPLLTMVLSIAAPAWAVTDAETAELATAYGALVDKYAPNGLGEYSVELNALLITAIIFGPRIKKPRYERKKKDGAGVEENEDTAIEVAHAPGAT